MNTADLQCQIQVGNYIPLRQDCSSSNKRFFELSSMRLMFCLRKTNNYRPASGEAQTNTAKKKLISKQRELAVASFSIAEAYTHRQLLDRWTIAANKPDSQSTKR